MQESGFFTSNSDENIEKNGRNGKTGRFSLLRIDLFGLLNIDRFCPPRSDKMKFGNLSPSELKLLRVIWESEPLRSGALAAVCLEKFGWKKSTVYTILKNICDAGFVENENGTVSSLVSEKDYLHGIASEFVGEHFGSSLPDFIAAYLDGKHMSRDRIIECYDKVKKYREE